MDKSKIIFTVFILFCSAQDSILAQNVPNDSLNRNDAITLCLRIQKEGVFLDSTLLSTITFHLEKARATRDTLNTIHAFPQYVTGQIILASHGVWTEKWRKGALLTGYEPIDSLLRRYNLVHVEVNRNWYLLTFAQPIHAYNLGLLFEIDSTILYAEPNYYLGDGNNIELVVKNGEWGFAFSHGSGDCPAGCIVRYYWYVSVKDSQPQFLESMYMTSSGSKIVPWMIPDRVKLGAYSSLDQIFSAAKNEPMWWRRKHAVRSLPELFAYMLPSTPPAVLQMANQAKVRRKEVFDLLQEKTNDSDPDVSRAAVFGLGMIVADYENYSAFYPLKNGNELYYKNSLPHEQEVIAHWKVLKDTVVGSRDQNKIVDDQVMFGRRLILYTTVSNGTVRYLDASQNYQIAFDFAADTGAQWNVDFTDKKYRVVLRSKNDSIASFRLCYRFDLYDRTSPSRLLRTIWMAPGFGIVATESYDKEFPSLIITDASRLAGINPLASVSGDGKTGLLSFVLSQNYPNPFNPETRIQYSFSSSSLSSDERYQQKVKLEIFDVLGRNVETLVNEFQISGSYSVPWNAVDKPTGVYFMRLVIGNKFQSKKMLFLK